MTTRDARTTTPHQVTTRRPLVGVVLAAIGVVHIAATPIFYGDALRSVLDSGVVASIEADPALVDLRSAGFWYVAAGLGIVTLGVVVTWAERRLGTVPAVLGWIMLGLAVWGVIMMPVSPFWAFFLVAGLAFRSARGRTKA